VTRRRLTPDDRRKQLVDIGAEMFAALPYDQVLMENVAERAGISRALLYRHFPGKRDLLAAVYQRAADELLDATTLDQDVPLAEQVVAGLDVHIDYFAANRHTVLAANRTLSGDPVIQAIITGELTELRKRVLVATGVTGRDRDVLEAILTSWLTFVRVLCVEWLTDLAIDRIELRDICLGALLGATGSIGLDPTAIHEK
jgi:AcrR family transcriptional regulator